MTRVLRVARRHAWIGEEIRPGIFNEKRLRVLGGVDLAPGDIVHPLESGAIRSREQRKNELKRMTARGVQIIASNLDDLVVLHAFGIIEGGEDLLVSCIAAAKAEKIEPVLVFNKTDLDIEGEMQSHARSWEKNGFEVYLTSALQGKGLMELGRRLRGRNAAFAGSSGAGKSTIINALVPGANQVTREVGKDGRGRHTTSLARGIPFSEGLIIDLPGVRRFGLFDESSLDAAFPDISEASKLCRFSDCVHESEPDCGVRNAIEIKEISGNRFELWQRVRGSIAKGREELLK